MTTWIIWACGIIGIAALLTAIDSAMELGYIRYRTPDDYPARKPLEEHHRKWMARAGIVSIPTLGAASYWIFEQYLSFIVALVAWAILFAILCAATYRRQEPVKPPLPLDQLPKRKK